MAGQVCSMFALVVKKEAAVADSWDAPGYDDCLMLKETKD